MNIEQLQGNWDQVKGQVKAKFGKLTNDDVASIHGKKDKFIGKLQERYGYQKDKAESELSAFVKDCKCGTVSNAGKPSEKQTASSRI